MTVRADGVHFGEGRVPAAARPQSEANVKPKAKPKQRSGGRGMWLPTGSKPPKGL